MARHKARARNQIRRPDRVRPEPQVRRRHRPGLLRVVHKVALRVVRRLAADDLDRILVRAHRAVRTQPVEQRPHRLRVLGRKRRIVLQARMAHIVVDADREVILRGEPCQLVEHTLHHRRRELLRRQPVPPANHTRHRCKRQRRRLLRQHRHNVLVKRLAARARLLGAVQHRNRLHRCRQRLQKCLASNGRYSRTFSRPTFSPCRISASTASSAASAPEPMITITRSASGAP